MHKNQINFKVLNYILCQKIKSITQKRVEDIAFFTST